jgi:hypothetical protein
MWKSFNSDGQEFHKFQQSKQSLLNLNHLTLKDYDIYNIENLGLDLGQTQQYDRFKTISYILGEHFYSRNQKCYWYPSHIYTIYWKAYYLQINCILGLYGGLWMITRPIWKCPCIKLFITYFRHLEKRHPYWPETKLRPILARANMGLDMEMIL